ncbi:MAG: SGNH/GDSL hydrolase family protein [Planctomycetota bacterium]|nr:SGNH/GDSL hydrolase family protein [Planctomycetota bacterium]
MTDPDAKVRYRRPPHLYWKGTAPGDMGPGDPFVEEVEFQTDADGFRNSTARETADIAFIGDSFTEAGNVREEHSFMAQTGVLLNLTVVNLGTAGYGPLEEVAVLEAFALKKQPKWVVWQLCEGNDLSDVVNFIYWQQLRGQTSAALTTDEVWGRKYSRWQRTSPFVRMAKLISGCREQYRIAAEGDFTLSDKSTTPMKFQVLPSEHTDPEYNRIRWEKTREALHLGQALCLNANTRLLVVVIPIKLRVFRDLVAFKSLPSRITTLPEQSKLSRFVQEACLGAGIEFLDPTAQFRDAAKSGEVVYFPFDTHLSPVGHRKLAELIAARIEKR